MEHINNLHALGTASIIAGTIAQSPTLILIGVMLNAIAIKLYCEALN